MGPYSNGSHMLHWCNTWCCTVLLLRNCSTTPMSNLQFTQKCKQQQTHHQIYQTLNSCSLHKTPVMLILRRCKQDTPKEWHPTRRARFDETHSEKGKVDDNLCCGHDLVGCIQVYKYLEVTLRGYWKRSARRCKVDVHKAPHLSSRVSCHGRACDAELYSNHVPPVQLALFGGTAFSIIAMNTSTGSFVSMRAVTYG